MDKYMQLHQAMMKTAALAKRAAFLEKFHAYLNKCAEDGSASTATATPPKPKVWTGAKGIMPYLNPSALPAINPERYKTAPKPKAVNQGATASTPPAYKPKETSTQPQPTSTTPINNGTRFSPDIFGVGGSLGWLTMIKDKIKQ